MALSDADLAFIEALLRDRAGLELTRWLVQARVEARASASATTLDRYVGKLRAGDEAEIGALLEAVRVGETRFFRHQSHVDAVREVVAPAWKIRGVLRPKVWSAGCASGEEAYTLAIVLAAALPSPTFQPDILATDVSPTALAVAAAGRYPRASLAHVPAAHRSCFDVDGDGIVVRSALRSTVSFLEENLATLQRPRRVDLVFCRNVLIYFDAETRARVLRHLVASLTPGGFLFLGYSESLRDVPGLRAVPWQGQVLWEKPVDGDARRSSVKEPADVPSARVAAVPPARPARPGPSDALGSASTTLRITSSTSATVAAPIDAALGTTGLTELVVDIDAAPFLEDDVADVFRRARAKAAAAGVRLRLRASRVGARRWLRRHGFDEGGDPTNGPSEAS